ncbi:MAG: hypothetical protein EAX96_08980 [Candidatus Lokiarchaeota archaeon]|nr:hypothetical protein [Candidatus Lokiarchaeota archaeon]
MSIKESLDRMFFPKSIAIIEASSKRPWAIEGIINRGYDGKLFLVSNNEDVILGRKCYKDISNLPDGIDHAIIAVNRNKLEKLVEKCIEKKFHTLHIFSAGGSEYDEQGYKIEKKLQNLLQNKLTHAIGPNCMGVYCPEGKISYSPLFSKDTGGNIALVSHSGDLTTQFVFIENDYGLKFSKVASIGNSIDLTVADFIDYFSQDKQTEIICVYFEGFSKYRKDEGKVIFHSLKNCKKQIIFLRGGISEVGKRAASSHTGTLASNDDIWQAIYKQANVNNVSSFDEFLDVTMAFDYFRYSLPKINSLLIIVWSGGKAVLSTDAIAKLGIDIPEIKDPKKSKLMEMISIGSVKNPLDLPWIFRREKFSEICNLAMDEDYIGGVILEITAPREFDESFSIVYNNIIKVAEHARNLKKPFLLSFPHSLFPNTREEIKNYFIKERIPVFQSIPRAATAFMKLYEYNSKSYVLNKR